MSVKKDNKTNKWYCRVSFKDHEGKYRTKTKKGFSTKKEAQICEQKLTEEIAAGIVTSDMSFADYFKTWVETYKLGMYSQSTDVKYLREIKYVQEYFKSRPISALTRSDYQGYLNMRGKNNGKDTVEKAHAKLKGALKNALADGLITKDITFGAVMRYDLKPNTAIKYWHEHEAVKLFDLFKANAGVNVADTILYLLLSTGLRVGEAYGLSWNDIDGNILSVERGYDYNHTNSFTNLKTSSSHRKILLSDECLHVLKVYKLKHFKTHSKYLFIDDFKRLAISRNGLSKHLAKVCTDNDIPVHSIHSLRHTHCSLMIYKGIDIQYISRRLGHKDVTITLSTYSHIIDELKQAQDTKILETMNDLECKISAK